MVRCDVSINLFFGGMMFESAEGEENILPTHGEIRKKLEKMPAKKLLNNMVIQSIEKG